eukprot:TRINITY_DN2309_c2_g1_i1.p1 TRINITY_DN2309_c2_g1~~TRINITY_DN2309_c2_g1_i1.p1  ORF type:complete len:396 (-),score=66.14 TRINITY_DN2309_c2_g1_i1:1079-2095(-)
MSGITQEKEELQEEEFKLINQETQQSILEEKNNWEKVEGQQLEDLPEAPEGLSGETIQKGEGYNLKVSNVKGYFCHVHLETMFPVPPVVLYEIFRNPDNSKVFRDIKEQLNRRVVFDDPRGVQVVQVEQIAELKVLPFVNLEFRTLLRVTEDQRNPDEITMIFQMLTSDAMSRFNGKWTLTKVVKEDDKKHPVWTRGILEQDVLPKGIPPWLKHIPVLGGLFRGVSCRTIRRIMEDLNVVVKRVNNGEELSTILKPIENDEVKVQSFMIDDFGEVEEDEDEEFVQVDKQDVEDAKNEENKELLGNVESAEQVESTDNTEKVEKVEGTQKSEQVESATA